jgi:hypothetical protein
MTFLLGVWLAKFTEEYNLMKVIQVNQVDKSHFSTTKL